MSIEDLTPEEIEALNVNIEQIEEPDEYKEYNDRLCGILYVFGYAGLKRKVKKGNLE